jgi:hypothetical protein
MWTWLNANANAIEAISAVLSVGVTAILVVITIRYVRLTQTLADAALTQSLAQVEASKARRRELQASVNFLWRALQSLPSSARREQHPEQFMRDSIRWDDFDFGRFRTLAAELNPQAASSAATVEAKMQWLESQRAQPRNMGLMDWITFPWGSGTTP